MWAWHCRFFPERTPWEGEGKTKSNVRLENLVMRAPRGDQVRFQQLHPQTDLGPGGVGGRGSWPTLRPPQPLLEAVALGHPGPILHPGAHLAMSLLGLLNILRHPGRPHDAAGRRPGSQRCPGREPWSKEMVVELSLWAQRPAAQEQAPPLPPGAHLFLASSSAG